MFASTRVVLAGLKENAQQSKSIQLCLFSTWNQGDGAMPLNEQFCMTLPPNRSINQRGVDAISMVKVTFKEKRPGHQRRRSDKKVKCVTF